MPANHQEEASWWKVNISCFALIFSVEADHVLTGPQGRGNPTYTLDGIPFFMVPITDVPPGYCEVDVIVNDNGEELDCMMVAGHVAFARSRPPRAVSSRYGQPGGALVHIREEVNGGALKMHSCTTSWQGDPSEHCKRSEKRIHPALQLQLQTPLLPT